MARKKNKEQVHVFELDGKNWKAIAKSGSALAGLINSLREPGNGIVPQLPSLNEIQNTDVRIVVAVAENPTYLLHDGKGGYLPGSVRLECGRAAAQAAHTVSRLKLSYVAELCQNGKTEEAYATVLHVMAAKVTTIVLKARDTSELQHIEYLASTRKMHSVKFFDENPDFYGPVAGGQVQTAIAIGPYKVEDFHGITNYLPLWKCKCDVVP